MKRLIIISAVFLIINSCSEESTIFDPTYFGDGFKGITFTGANSPEAFKADPTDWCPHNSNYFYKTKDDSGVVSENNIPWMDFSFEAAYPNPVAINGSTRIRYSIPVSTYVYIYVINKDYKVLAILVNREHSAGIYEVSLDANKIGIGVFRVIIETEHFNCKGDIWIIGS